MSLRDKIAQEIRRRGPIPFSRYMEICLYDGESGFYSGNAERFGKAGDFYTSSDLHAVFGRLLARQFEEAWRIMGRPGQIQILELGPGRGLFARDVLDWTEQKFPEFFAALHYSLIESSPVLRVRLVSTLGRHFESGKAAVAEKDGAISSDVPAIVFANEFFDAFPVEVVATKGKLFVDFQNNDFVERWHPPDEEERKYLDRYGVRPEESERVEVGLPASAYMSEIARAVDRGFVFVVDYGYTRQQQVAGRYRGTLMTFRQHSTVASPYAAPGEQDITAHVNFSALTAAAEEGGLQVYPLVTQSQFLIGIGEANQFADVFDDCRVAQERAKVALQLKHLITPSGMGEAFQVMVACKGIEGGNEWKLQGLSFRST